MFITLRRQLSAGDETLPIDQQRSKYGMVSWTITKPRFTLGRNHDCDVRLGLTDEDKCDTVSRLHAEIVVSGQTATIFHRSSTNRTWVNDTDVGESQVLNSGDIISLAGVKLVISFDNAVTGELSLTIGLPVRNTEVSGVSLLTDSSSDDASGERR